MVKVLQTPSRSISKKQKREYCGINELPDEVLRSILCHIPMKEAARTSVLSRRWEKLWKSHPCLVFDGSDTLDDIGYMSKKILKSERFKYINWVNNVLESHEVLTIDEFKVRFDLNDRYQSDVDQWVRFAFGKEVKRFELDLSSCQQMFQYSCYRLRSRTLRFQTPTSLTSLILNHVSVSGGVLENLVSNNPFLQYLCVGASSSLVRLRLAGPSLCLTHLEISFCKGMRSLELDAPNLSSLKYSGKHIEMRFINVPNLAEICFRGMYVETCVRNYILPPVATFAPQLQKLVLGMMLKERKMKRLVYPTLSQLKELELRVTACDDDSLLCLSSLINASPSLNRLWLQLNWSKSYMKREVKKVKSPHYSLKVVEITGFVGRRVDTEFCMYLIENAVMLEKMSIDPSKYEKGYVNYKPKMSIDPSGCVNYKPERKRAAREQAEHLRSKYGLGDKLVIL